MTTSLQQRVEIEKIGMVCRFTVNAFIGLVVIGAVLAYVVSLERSALYAWSWYGAMVLMVALRWLYHRKFLERMPDVGNLEGWRLFIVGGGAVTGLGWSIPATWMLPESIVVQLFICACLMGVVSAAVSVLAPLRGAFAWFVVPLLVPVAATQMYQRGNQIYIGLGLLVFLGAMLGVAVRYHADVTKMLLLALENQELADKLSRENERVAHTVEQLQEQITERQRAESAAQSAKAEAELASRAKSQFLANVSHEVRTPLNAILGMTELLRRTTLDAKQSKYADTAYRAGERLLGIIDDILDLARIEAGRLRMQPTVFPPRMWLTEVFELMSPQAAAKSLALTSEVTSDVPLQIEGDAERLRQVLTNLLANALKFTRAGGVHVKLSVEHRDTGACLRCTVTDTGIGISLDAQARLFQPFSQVDDTATRRFGGAGLGLAICSQLIEAMHGKLGVDSEPGRGSTFWFCIPLNAVHGTHAVNASGSAPDDSPVNARVLVAEDTELNRELIVDMLRLAGCTVCAVDSGHAALKKLEHETFDTAIIDWHMPDLDGLSAIRQLRERERTLDSQRRLPIIVLTASAMPGDREVCLLAGADEYLSKPFTYDELVATLRGVLQ